MRAIKLSRTVSAADLRRASANTAESMRYLAHFGPLNGRMIAWKAAATPITVGEAVLANQ